MNPRINKKTKLREPFFVVAHQIKNPISIIRWYIEVLLSQNVGKLNKKQEDYLNDSLANVQKIIKIVRNMSDVSNIEGKLYKIHPESVDLKEIVQDAVLGLSAISKASNCEIIFKKPEAPYLINADPGKIRQVIKNFILNAIQYKSQEKGRIEVELQKKGKQVLFVCRDNGIGVPSDELDKIFSKFYRSEDAISVDPSGTGLGLYISKAIIDLSGGKIWFEKNKDQGMTFYFALQLVVEK